MSDLPLPFKDKSEKGFSETLDLKLPRERGHEFLWSLVDTSIGLESLSLEVWEAAEQ